MKWAWGTFWLGLNQGLVIWLTATLHDRWWAPLACMLVTGANYATLALRFDARRLAAKNERMDKLLDEAIDGLQKEIAAREPPPQ